MNIITTHRSPNFEPRRNGAKPSLVILHYTGMKDGEAALARLVGEAAKVSAHYLVEEDGRIFALVDEKDRAWHAGASFWKRERDINSHSIGIEIVNPGHECGYRAFPQAQMEAVKALCMDIKARHNLPARAFWGHSDVAPMRKEDPGELFDWPFLASSGIGIWPEKAEEGRLSKGEAVRLLEEIGYEAGPEEEKTKAAIRAFQRHFRPSDFSGAMDTETASLIRAVASLKA